MQPKTILAINQVNIDKGKWSCEHDSIGNMIISGTVSNSSNYDLQFVELRGTVYTASGDVVNTNTSYIDSDILGAKSTSTFDIYVDDPDERATKCGVRVEDARFK